MDEAALIDDAWKALIRLSEADRNARSYTWWAKLNFEKDKTMLMVNESIFRAALRETLAVSDIADFQAFLATLDRKAAERQRQRIDEMMVYFDPEERTAEW